MDLYENKYKDALDLARTFYEGYIIQGHNGEAGILAEIFPELKSEDERIKREILELVSIAGNGNQFEEIKDWLEKQGKQKQTWKPNAAQLIVIKDLIEDKNTSKVNKVILRGMFDEFKQFTNTNKREIDDAYLQGICDAKHEIEKQGEQPTSERSSSDGADFTP